LISSKWAKTFVIKALAEVRAATPDAISPFLWPPIPSAMTHNPKGISLTPSASMELK
jgi:hypothetical protein